MNKYLQMLKAAPIEVWVVNSKTKVATATVELDDERSLELTVENNGLRMTIKLEEFMKVAKLTFRKGQKSRTLHLNTTYCPLILRLWWRAIMTKKEFLLMKDSKSPFDFLKLRKSA